MKKILIIFVAAVGFGLNACAQTLDGTTWSYTERSGYDSELPEFTMYFAFTSPTQVIWYFGADQNYVIPVGWGSYNAQKGIITFLHTHILNKKNYLFAYRDNPITFGFRVVNGQATMISNDKDLLRELPFSFNDGQAHRLNKERYSLTPNTKLVGTSWKYIDGENYTDYENNYGTMYYKSENEVLIDGRILPYTCIGNSISIMGGDNPFKEVFFGTYGSEKITFCSGGAAVKIPFKNHCIELIKIQQ